LVGTPGTGKSEAIDPIQDLFYKAKLPSGQQWHLSPDNMTKASMVDCLVKAHRSVMHQGVPLTYHYLILIQSELSALMATYDTEFLAVLTKLFDCRPKYDEARRWAKNEQQAVIENPGMSVLMGVQPGMAATLLPEEAWQVGFTSRLILIYSNEEIDVDPFRDRPKQKALEANLIHGLNRMGGAAGQIVFTPEARDEFAAWRLSGYAPKPGHPKLIHYTKRRGVHALKLSMISAISRGNFYEVTPFDVLRAKMWMLDAEGEMAKIFPAMNKGTDQDLMNSLWYFVMNEYTNNGGNPLPRAQLAEFLGGHVKVERISQLLNHAEDSWKIRRNAGFENLYFPCLPTDKRPEDKLAAAMGKEKPQAPEGDWGSAEP
jgi:hypothetical protein